MKPEWVEGARWFATVALIIYVVMLTQKSKRVRQERDNLRLSLKASKDVLKLFNEDASFLRSKAYALEQRLRDAQKFNYHLEKAPQGNLQLLTLGGGRILGELGSVQRAKDMGIVAWAATAARDKDEEVRIGMTQARRPD